MIRSILSLAALLVVSSVASAQFGNLGQPPARRPAVSPYINQSVGGGINANSYYGIIKPQFETNRALNQLQTGVQLLNADGSLKGALSQTQQPNALGGMQTGHPATYFNYSHYFPMSYGSTGATGSASSFGTGVGGGAGGGGANAGMRSFYGSSFNNAFGR